MFDAKDAKFILRVDTGI